MTRRLEKVGSAIRRIVADAIQHRLSDPRVAPLTSVTRVVVSADLSAAKIYVSVLAPAGKKSATIRALKHAGGHLRSVVASDLQLRHAPELFFYLDESLQRGAETIELLDRTLAEDRARQEDRGETTSGPPSPQSEQETQEDDQDARIKESAE